MLKKELPYIALATAAVIWGVNTPVMKMTLEFVPLFSLAFLRFFLASLILFPFVYKKLHFQREDLFSLFVCSFVGITMLITLFFLGVRMTTALNAGIISGTLPMVNLIFAYLFLKEKITRKIFIGTSIGLLGLSVIIGRDLLTQGLDVSPFGDVLVFCANIASVMYNIYSKKLLVRYSPLALTFITFFIGSIFLLPGAIWELYSNPAWPYMLPPIAYMGTLYGIFFSSLAAFAFWQYGLAKVDETKVGFFFYIVPIVSTITAVSFLGENITEEFLIGTLLIFIGLFITEAHLHHKKALHH